ncbi:MAG: haloalkane dehalogenase [Bryobacterales bacterium]|nr:haloalkane dehalogenase [Bryobacterales bacterium]
MRAAARTKIKENHVLSNGDKCFIEIDGVSMAYQDLGSGDPIVFLHGNPTSSFLWRNIIPHLQSFGRCIAPDLIGMGDSEKLANSGTDSYTFVENRRYLDGFFDALGLKERVTLVVHDWGSALGFDWAKRNPNAVRGIVHMEAIVAAMDWEDIPAPAQPRFRGVRSEEGEELVVQQNIFIEQSIVRGTMRPYTDAEMAEYRRPFLQPGEGRRPMLTWPRQLPIGGEPSDVVAIVDAYAVWLSTSAIPKLYIRAEPGTQSEKMIRQVRTWPNQQEVAVGGIHYPQEDSPEEIGASIAAWVRRLKAVE